VTRLNDLLHNAQTGLLPYLQAKIASDFSNLIVRQYTFGSASQRTGYRIRSIRTQIEHARVRSRTVSVAIGKLIDIVDDVNDYQIIAGDFANSLGDAIAEWSVCRPLGLKSAITDIDANLALLQNPTVTGSSSAPAAWCFAVILSFQMEYWD
jgi:hypothetical protein